MRGERHGQLIYGRESCTVGGFSCIKVGLCVQKVGVHKTRKNHAHPKCKTCSPPWNGAKVRNKIACVKNVAWRLLGLDLSQFGQGIDARQTLAQSLVPIIQSCMVARNHISEYACRQFAGRTVVRTQGLYRPQGTCC